MQHPSKRRNFVQHFLEFDYEFIVYTGDIAGAGTDSKVSMTLYGEKGDSGELVLDKEGSDDFERNS